jgi:DNA-binding transcriptional MerR regulator
MLSMSSYSLSDLSDLADVTARTIRYYIAQGLLRPPEGAGVGARYDDGHLHRLRMIRRLQRDHLPLAEIRKRLAALSDDEVTALLTEETVVRDSASDYIAAVLRDRGIARPSHQAAPPPRWRSVAAMAEVDPQMRASVAQADPQTRASMPPALTRAQVEALAEDGSPSSRTPERSQWDRIALDEDIELHVRRPLTRDQNRTVDRIVAISRELLKEDPQ